MKNKIAIFTLSLLGLYQPAQAVTLIGWDLPTSTTTVTTVSAFSTATGVTAGNISIGTGLTLSSSSTGWRATSYGTTTTDSAALAAANTANDYWAFQFGASSGYSVVVDGIGSGQWGISGTGPTRMSLIYSTNSSFSSFSTIATASSTAVANTNNFAAAFTTALAAAPITIAEGATAYFRLVGYGASASTGTGGLISNLTAPDFSILGTSTSTTLLNWSGGAGTWANGTAAAWTNGLGTSTAWAAGKDATLAAGGTLAVDAGGITAGALTVSGATAATLTGGAVTTGSLTLSSGSTLNLNNTSTAVSGSVDLTDATLSGGALSAVTNVAVSVTTGTKTISTALSGAAALAKSGAGELILTASNSYSGQTGVAAGTLTTGGANVLSDTGTLKLDNLATFKLGGNETVGNINAINGSTNNLQSFTLTSGGNNLSATNGALTSGSGGLVKNGSGLMYMNQSGNTYSGGFTLNSGEVQFSSSGNAGAGGVTNSMFGTGTLSLNGGIIGSSSATSGRNVYNNVSLNGNVQFGQTAWGTTNIVMNSGSPLLTVSTNANSTTTLQSDSTINTLGAVQWEQSINGSAYRLTKTGTGDSSLSNNYLALRGSNNIAGVTVSSGTLDYKNRNALGTGTLILGDGIMLGQSGTINNTATADIIADRTVANNISLLGNVTLGTGGTSSYFSGNLDLNNGNRTVTLQNSTYLFGSITNGGLVVDRLGTDLTSSKTLFLYGANTYTNGTTVNGVAGRTNNVTLSLGNDSALGSGSLTFAGASGSTNSLQALTQSTADQSRTIANNISIGTGVNMKAETINSIVSYSTGSAVTSSVSVNMALNGLISGGGSLTKSGSNSVTLGGANTYSGGTTVSGGTLIGTTTSLQGNIANNAALVFAQAANGSYSSVISGSGSLTKTNSGTTTLSATNTYTGATTVSAGSLLVDTLGSIANSSTATVNGGSLLVKGRAGTVVVNSGGALGGSGSVGALRLNSGGSLNPGNSPGTLTAASAIVLGGSTYNWQVTALTGTAGTTWDLLSVTGLLDLSGVSSGSKWNLAVTGDGGFAGWNDGNEYSYVFAKAASVSGFSTTVGTDVTSLFNITASGVVVPNASYNPAGDFKVVVGSEGGLTTLNLLAVPEPSTGALLAFGVGGLVLTRLLRRKQS